MSDAMTSGDPGHDSAERWVVIGAGSAGCVVAARLSEHPDRHVTLVDDGPPLDPGQVPAGIAGSSFFAAMAEPERIHADLVATRTADGPATLYQRGRGVGGSSSVNAMVALRGSAAMYERWGWHDADQAWDAVALPMTPASIDEVGAVDLAVRAQPGGEPALLTRQGGRRVTSAEAYLWPVLDRPNLVVRPLSAVDRIRFAGNKATGVLLTNGVEVGADHVVVCAGAIHSPALLLRSKVATAGLGSGLQDHPSVVFTLQLRPDAHHDPHRLPIASVLHDRVGDDIIQLLPLSHLGADPAAAGLGALMVASMTPHSATGRVSLDSAARPDVHFDMLSNRRDLAVLSEGVRRTLKLFDTPAFRDIVASVFIDDRGTSVSALDSPQAIEQWVQSACGDYVHASSTCAMGRVVDERFRVVGYEGLFVCDASVFPQIPDANTHLPTTMVAERFCRQHVNT